MDAGCEYFELRLDTAPDSVEIDHERRELVVSCSEQEERFSLTADIDEDQVQCTYDRSSRVLKISVSAVVAQPSADSEADVKKHVQLARQEIQEIAHPPSSLICGFGIDGVGGVGFGSVESVSGFPLFGPPGMLHTADPSSGTSAPPQPSRGCAVCGAASSLRCSKCKSEVYCGTRHQTQAWHAAHKLVCTTSQTIHRFGLAAQIS